jgi:hypothetical protein
VLKPACFSSNKHTAFVRAVNKARCCFQGLPRASTSRFAILSTPLALLARRTPEQTSLFLLFAWRGQLVLASSSRPAAAAPRVSHAETEGAPACLLRPLTITEPVPVQTSPLSRLCPSSTDAPVRFTKPTRSKPSSRRHHPARRAAVTAHSRQPLILYFSRRQRRRFEGARARKLSHNARPSPALSTPETPHGGSLRLSPEPVFGSLSRKGLQAEGPSRDGASAPTLTL